MAEPIQKSVILDFPRSRVDKPVISWLVRRHQVDANIVQARVTPNEAGRMFVILEGLEADIESALQDLRDEQVRTVLPVKNLVWEESHCVHCGACVGTCLSGAFSLDAITAEVCFDSKLCLGCDLCIQACWYGALESISTHLSRTGDL